MIYEATTRRYPPNSDFFCNIVLFFSNDTNSMISSAFWNLGQRFIRRMRQEVIETGGRD
jgi:hypothetical protein